jgi:DnaJ-class molecular chaperone
MEKQFTFDGALEIVRQATLARHGIDIKRVPSSRKSEDCKVCNGTGYVLAPNGADDVDKEVCPSCGGTGRVVATD